MTTDISLSKAEETPRYEPEAPGFKPWRILEVEISQPLPAVSAADVATGYKYERALALVRLHTQPLGVVELQLDMDGLTAEDYAREIWQALRAEITEHLHRDGVPEPTALEATGLPSAGTPPCMQERETCLANAPFVSVVVATHDRPANLAACLRALLSLDYPNYEIIVVDNAPSTSATADFIRQTYGHLAQVRYVREDRPGLACAHNRALMEVTAPLVAFTDDDVVVDRYWLAELVRGFSAADAVGCVTGSVFPAELETPAQAWFEQFGGFSKDCTRRVFDLGEHRPRNPLYPYAAGALGTGANMAFRVAALREVGAFDPALGTGTAALAGDDQSAFLAIIAAGYALVYEPAAIVHHQHRRSYAELRRQIYGYGVGVTAYLTKAVVERPGLLLDIIPRLPRAVAYVMSTQSPKNRGKRVDYPRELTTIERKGLLYGPVAYLRSRRQAGYTGTARHALPGPGAPSVGRHLHRGPTER